MNVTLELLHKRSSLRSFSDQVVDEASREALLDAARRAPSAGNLMLYSIIDVRDAELKKQLSESCDHQAFIAKAPVVLIFLADLQRLWDLYAAGGVEEYCRSQNRSFPGPELSDLMLASCDAMAAAQNAVIAAESMGMGSCYIGDIMEQIELHRKLLNLPDAVFPLSMLVLGYPSERQKKRKIRDRYPRWSTCFRDSYHQLSEEELYRMHGCANREELSTKALRIFNRKTGATFSEEMRRSVRSACSVYLQDK